MLTVGKNQHLNKGFELLELLQGIAEKISWGRFWNLVCFKSWGVQHTVMFRNPRRLGLALRLELEKLRKGVEASGYIWQENCVLSMLLICHDY